MKKLLSPHGVVATGILQIRYFTIHEVQVRQIFWVGGQVGEHPTFIVLP